MNRLIPPPFVSAATRCARRGPPIAVLLCAILLASSALSVPRTAPAHGETEASVDEFHEHLDDYEAEIVELQDETDAIVAGYAAGEDVSSRVDGLVAHWEEVAVHGAIETHVIVTYPTIWQAIIGLKQAIAEGKAAEEVRRAGDGVGAALWQGFGALRFAATQVEPGERPTPGELDKPAESSAASIAAIIDELEQAVQAYADGEPSRAEKLIHEAYMQRFEYLEGDLIEQDPELVSRLEQDFNANLPLLIQQGADIERVRAQLASMVADLQHAGELLAQAREARSEVF